MLASPKTVSCNFPSVPLKSYSSFPKSSRSFPNSPILSSAKSIWSCGASKVSQFLVKQRRGGIRFHQSSINSRNAQESSSISPGEGESEVRSGGGGDGGEGRDWTTSFLLLTFWLGLMYYVFFLAPDQTPVTDMYFLKKLVNVIGDDGFELNKVLVAEWYIMGLWPLVYSMLLIPSGRSSNDKIPIWPFLILSFFGGAYALIPYFVLWRPPAPPVKESECRRWPLNFLDSKFAAGVTVAAGLAVFAYALSASGDGWREFYQYFRGSKFIHIMTIDFVLFSTFAPFWVYNDLTARKWYDKGFWLIPLSLIPFLGPALYLLLRASLSPVPTALAPTTDEN